MTNNMNNDYTTLKQAHNRRMMGLGATTIYDVGDLTSIYSQDREKYGAFYPTAGYKQCTAPYEKQFASYDGEIVGESGKLLKTSVNNAGYEVLGVNLNGKHTTACIHRLVASAWLPDFTTDRKFVVDHLDDDKLNNIACNLRIVNTRQNLIKPHRMKQMSTKKGKQTGVAVVKVDDLTGERTTYKSLSAAGKANGVSAVSVTGNAKHTLKLDRPYHFEFLDSSNTSEH